ncbi:MAG: QueT transporter family protein [Clostridiales bacterium]|nr:QueT transporter family protein [Clostridiales bacterium]
MWGDDVDGRKQNIRTIVYTGVVAALYVVLTLPFAQVAYGPVQFRMAEALTILPVFGLRFIPGVSLGCLIANVLNPGSLGPVDIIFGTLATVIAGFGSRWIGKKKDVLGIIPPIIANGLIVGFYLPFLLVDEGSSVKGSAILISMGEVALSEAVVMVLIGLPFLLVIKRTSLKDKL